MEAALVKLRSPDINGMSSWALSIHTLHQHVASQRSRVEPADGVHLETFERT